MTGQTFTNSPKILNESDYYSEINKFLSLASPIKDVEHIFQYGSINSVGLSDIDILLVMSDNPSKESINTISKICKGGNHLENFDIYSFKIIPSSFAKKINILGQINTKLLYGDKNFTFEACKDIEDQILVFDILDWLPERIKNLESGVKQKSIDLIFLMGDIFSMAHSLRRIIKLYESQLILDYLRDLQELRNNWYSIGKEIFRAKLMDLAFLGIEVGDHALRNFIKYLNKEKIAYYTTPNSGENFRFDIGGGNYLSSCSSNSIVTPSFIGEYLKFQISHCEGALKKMLIKNFESNKLNLEIKINSVYKEVLIQRCMLNSKIFSFNKKNRLSRRRLYRFGHLS